MNRLCKLLGIIFILVFVSESVAGILGDQIRYGKIGQGVKVGDGRTVVHPTFEQRGTFDSNIFLDANNAKNDFFFDSVPGVEVEVPFSKHLLTAGYMVDFANYCRYNSQNSNDQNFFTHLNLDFGKFYLKQNNRFLDTTARSGTEFTDKVERRNWTFDVTGGLIRDRFTHEVGYSFFFERYVKSIYNNLDRNEHVITSTSFYRLFPKTELLCESNYGHVSYVEENGGFRDNNFGQIRGGVRGQITKKLTGIGKVGWMGKRYPAPDQPDVNAAVAYLGFIEKFSETTMFTVSFDRSIQESTWLNNNFYLYDVVSLQVDQKIMSKLDGFFRFSYGRSSYPKENIVFFQTDGRVDQLWTIDVGADYTIKEWVKAGLQYEYMNNGSDFAYYNYDRHQLISRLSFRF